MNIPHATQEYFSRQLFTFAILAPEQDFDRVTALHRTALKEQQIPPNEQLQVRTIVASDIGSRGRDLNPASQREGWKRPRVSEGRESTSLQLRLRPAAYGTFIALICSCLPSLNGVSSRGVGASLRRQSRPLRTCRVPCELPR